MKKIKIVVISVLLCFYFTNSYSKTYYISNSGQDTNDGLSPVYPIKSITKLNSLIFKLQPGDVVLFERGGEYSGQININSPGNGTNPIIFGAFGKGNNPVISGSIPVSDWEVFKGNILKTYVNGIVTNFFLNEDQMVLARYPNTGFLKIDKPYSDKKSGFTNREFKNFSKYWNGAIARIRTENWAYEYSSIKDFKNGSFTLQDKTFYPIVSGTGFYLDNILNELDAENEWYFQKGKKDGGNLYFYPPPGKNIKDFNLKATVYDNGFFSLISLKNIIIRDLDFKDQAVSGIYFAGNLSDVTIENCSFKGQNKTGIYLTGKCNNSYIKNCRFENINGKAISLRNFNNSEISECVFRNIGMIPGFGTTGDPFPMSGIVVYGNKNLIRKNYFNSIGHDPVVVLGDNYLIENNIIKNSLLLLNDGGGIKCYGKNSNNSVWNNNFIYNIKGNTENNSPDKKEIIAHGIYLDELSNNITVKNNSISYCGLSGIGMNAGYDNTLENNNCFDNFIGMDFYQYELFCRNNVTGNNVVSGNSENRYSMQIKSLRDFNIPGVFKENFYFNYFNAKPFRIIDVNIAYTYDFGNWKDIVKSELKSVDVKNNDTRYSKLFSNMTDDTLTYLMKADYNFKDKNLNSVYSSIKLPPWTSEILFSHKDPSKEPQLTASGGNLDFKDFSEESSSRILWFNLSGENLTEPVSVAAPDGFEISLHYDRGFTESMTIYPGNGIAEEIIFVRFSPDESKGYYDYIINRSGKEERRIKVTGKSK
ncbi:MAG TPA: right-handed parallel beta-helix repeat-containing protein [Ignavibacteria bacterium]|nr:right-handed parallel beta-helix repeat-containing protein [Ignavibacteria bacterium]HMR41630.1 right-handed parallel beta-helix repeat-containing protein [Ignavibacteria bacterium]